MDVFGKIREKVREELSCSAHNMDHVERVYNLCLKLAEGEDVDMEVLKAAALLHDIARVREDDDHSGKTDHALLGAEMAAPILKGLGFPEGKIKHIQDCIITHRYRTGREPESLEARILFDADKLDIIGAVGIARSFMWVGRNNAPIYRKVDDINEYAKDNLEGGKINGRIKDKTKHSTNIELETKWRHIGERLHTKKAKEVFRERFRFSEEFMKRMEREIKGLE